MSSTVAPKNKGKNAPRRPKGSGGVFWSSDMVFSIAGDLARFVTDQFLSR